MTSYTPHVDYSGARGSNTGDQFHELWALQQVLDLLQPETDLVAVGVEGVRTETPPQSADDPTWAGVDCTLYYGGTDLETADQIEFVQLKYSAANPETAWSVARLVNSIAKKKNNSIIRKMANDFKGASARMKRDAHLKIRLVSNQNIAKELKKAIDTRWSGTLERANISKTRVENLKRLRTASGLKVAEFQEFLEALDFSECGYDSRFAVREKVIATIADLLGDDVLLEARDLQIKVRELMLPERAREIVTDKDILHWFGLGGRKGLFPCPPDIQTPKHAVKRSATDDVVRMLKMGERLVLVHGVGGCGKTTMIRQIADRLPENSVTVFFDCFGGGRYIYSDDKRHLPENAFLQMANELAVSLHIPFFIPRKFKYPATTNSFLSKLHSAGKALKQIKSDGKLLIVVDAADNSVAAAHAADPKERSFVFDLFGANLSTLPENVHFLVSCRTDPDRKASLRLPAHTPEVICQSFTETETKLHLESVFRNPDDSLIEKFHSLSRANPRVQSYAIAAANGDPDRLLESLLPGGKSVPDVLRASFKNALCKLGYPQIFERLVCCLAFLPAPVAVPSLARIVGCTDETVRDFALDLTPGLRLSTNAIAIADEDFVTFIKNECRLNRDVVIADIAEDFISTFQNDPYSSLHIADFLILAGQPQELLSVIERDPHASAIGDLIVRRQTQIRRLKLSLALCGKLGSTIDALKTVLISAEAERDDNMLDETLESELDLAVEFGGASLRRTILLEPDRVQKHGSFLAQDAVRAIRSGDRATAREQLYFYEAWLRGRRAIEDKEVVHWSVTDRDISALVETVLELDGPKAAFDELFRWKPREACIRAANILVTELIAADKAYHIEAILKECPPPKPFDLLLWVPMAMAGEAVDGIEIEKSLQRIKRRFIPEADAFPIARNGDGWREKLLDTYISACELSFQLNLNSQIILGAVKTILEVLEGKQARRLYGSDVYRFDGLIRCWLLREIITKRAVNYENFIAYVKALNPEPKQEKRRGGKGQKKRPGIPQANRPEVERLDRQIRAIFPVYSARLDILSLARKNQQIEEEQLKKLGEISVYSYDFDYDHHSTYLRDMAAQSVMNLMIVEDISAADLFKHASALAEGRFSDLFAGHRQKLWNRMRLRTTEADKLLLLVAKAAEDIKGLREPSSEKLSAMVLLSRLILPVSRDDAESLFDDALSLAKEIDREAFDQIEFLSVLSGFAHISEQIDRKSIAADIFSFVSGVSERLSGHDGFPWDSAVSALASLDAASALAAICRWADGGTIELDYTLERFLITALQKGAIDVETSTSLALLIGGSDGDLLKEILSRIMANPEKYMRVIDELAKENLLLVPQNRRLLLGQEIIDRISLRECTAGPWLSKLRETITYLKTLAGKPEKEEKATQCKMFRRVNNINPPKKFELHSEGSPFVTPQSIDQVLEAAKASGLPYDDREILIRMRRRSNRPRDRIPFLNALSEASEDSIWSRHRVEMIHGTVTLWKGTPAIDRWCKKKLPSVLITHFYGATPWLKEGQSALDPLLDYCGVDAEGRLQIILSGVARVGEALSSRTLFAIAEEIASALNEEEAGALLVWYLQRLTRRLPVEEQSLHFPADIPEDTSHTIARFLFALMSDIDKRIRWKAAHALRVLAKFGCSDIVEATVSLSDKVNDEAFRDPTGPFYFLAAKLWLTISLYRISLETPEALSSCKTEILDLATSSELPHVGIREYAKRTLLHLDSTGIFSLTSFEVAQLDQINIALKGQTTTKRENHRMTRRREEDKHRFQFDDTDTIPYWYDKIQKIFPDVSLDQVLDIAEEWILNKWGADPEANFWNKEPRKARYDERRFGLWSHRGGVLPTVERYGTYLEWNAMHCVVGELLKTHPISIKGEGYYYSFDDWFEDVLPTDPPRWLSDNRCATPLETRFWKEDPKTDRGWLHHIRHDEFLTEIGLCTSLREGWIVIYGNHTTHFPKRDTNIQIRSALVSPETAPALVRALQTASDPWDFRIPDEDDELQVNTLPYRLLGWVTLIEGGLFFDEMDPYRYEVGKIRAKPGRKLTEALELVLQANTYHTWICRSSREAAFIYEAWCDEPPFEEGRYQRGICSNGWRLWAKADIVQSFLINEGLDLICEVQVERKLRDEYVRSYEANAKRKTHDKILHLGADGSVFDVKGLVGSWAGFGRGVGP